jgi:ADP-ribose pyrophosphatase YjhB (NUDIX family)
MSIGPHGALTHAGGVVYRDGVVRTYLVVTAKKRADHWLYPKGHLEPGESPEACAVREVREESGVHAEVVRALSDSVLELPQGRQFIRFFLMRFVAEGPADEARTVAWLPFSAALERLTFEDTRELLRHAEHVVASLAAVEGGL